MPNEKHNYNMYINLHDFIPNIPQAIDQLIEQCIMLLEKQDTAEIFIKNVCDKNQVTDCIQQLKDIFTLNQGQMGLLQDFFESINDDFYKQNHKY